MFLLSPKDYVVKKVSKKGRGVFARKEIPAGTIIGDYVGQIITDEEALRRETRHHNDIYAMNYTDNLSIFPDDHSNTGIHLLNHSCSSNCEIYEYYGHKLFFALRRILPKEELTIDYSLNPGLVNEKDFLYPCFCKSPFCRGTMYASRNKLKSYHSFCSQKNRNHKFKLLRAGDVLRPLEKYPKHIKDEKVFNLFANLKATPVKYSGNKVPLLSELRKYLRDGGRILDYYNLKIKILAIVDNKIIIKK